MEITRSRATSGLAGDAEPAVVARLEILADHGGQQLSRPSDLAAEVPSVQHAEAGERVSSQLGHELLAGGRVVPVTDRLAARGVVVVAGEHRPQLCFQAVVDGGEELADRGADHGHRVLRGDRVIQRRGVQHPLGRHDPGPARCVQADLEDPPWPLGPLKPGAHVDQHRVHEPRVVEVQAATRVLPASVELERVDRFAVRQAEQPLQHHHRRHDLGRHRPAARRSEQVGEQLVGEQHMALPVQHRPDRVVLHPPADKAGRALHQISLPRRQPQRHRHTIPESHMPVILPDPSPKREHSRPRKTPAT